MSIADLECRTICWSGCYDCSYRGFITDTSFQHPAKMARGLLERIIDYGLSQGFWKRGDCLLDPFGGVGTTGLVAAWHGLRSISCELEPRFHNFSMDNLELHRAALVNAGLPVPMFLQWDSRRLCEVVGQAIADGLISSPPFCESLHDAPSKQILAGSGARLGAGARQADGYGSTPGQLGSLPAGSVEAVVSSPPYAGNEKSDYLLSADGKTRARDERRGYRQGEGCYRGSETYEQSDGQLGAMASGSIDGAIGSPPYADSIDHAPGNKTWDASCGVPGNMKQEAYGFSAGQLGALPAGSVDGCLASPPYEEGLGHVGVDKHPERACHNSTGRQMNQYGGYNLTSADNLGNSTGQTFWQAACEIVAQSHALMKSGGVSAWVVKSFVKNGKRVDFPDDWCRLLESCGFKVFLRVHAMLVKVTAEGNDLFGVAYKKTKERKSFFRRMAERKGSPPIDFEEVIWAVKE